MGSCTYGGTYRLSSLARCRLGLGLFQCRLFRLGLFSRHLALPQSLGHLPTRAETIRNSPKHPPPGTRMADDLMVL